MGGMVTEDDGDKSKLRTGGLREAGESIGMKARG